MLSLYELAWKPAAALIGRTDAQVAHARTVGLMRRADGLPQLGSLARSANHLVFPDRPTLAGGVTLPHPLILAAGLVKGDGFSDESGALAAVDRHRNIVPGWRTVPALLGAAEFGSFTRHPRLGNAGKVLWRDQAGGSMQNRVGLRNPGARAAARYLRIHAQDLPATWGVNLAVSPGLEDADDSAREIEEAAALFVRAFKGVEHGPAWYTLNLSCPNTEDDPRGNQTEALARRLSTVLVDEVDVPVWVKIGPDLSETQLAALVRAFAEVGVRAVVATNTMPEPAPGGDVSAGVSGARLRPLALRAVERLSAVIDEQCTPLDVIACGGILHGSDLLAFQAAGARAAMLYSALVFRGPLAPALILREARLGDGRG